MVVLDKNNAQVNLKIERFNKELTSSSLISSNYNDRVIKAVGAACSSFNSTNPCQVVGALGVTNGINDLMYVVNSKQRFITSDDGMFTQPSLANGNLQLTNGGGTSIMMVYHASSPNS